MRDVAFTLLSILIETAGSQLRVGNSGANPAPGPGAPGSTVDMREARAAIDAANALLGSVRSIMESDAILAIEGMLTQLQIEYVSRMSRSS
jgi:hypothetical protein